MGRGGKGEIRKGKKDGKRTEGRSKGRDKRALQIKNRSTDAVSVDINNEKQTDHY